MHQIPKCLKATHYCGVAGGGNRTKDKDWNDHSNTIIYRNGQSCTEDQVLGILVQEKAHSHVANHVKAATFVPKEISLAEAILMGLRFQSLS